MNRLQYQLTKEDSLEFARLAVRRANRRGDSALRFGSNLLVYIPFGISAAALWDLYDDTRARAALIGLAGLLVFLVAATLAHVVEHRRWTRKVVDERGWFLAPATLSWDGDSIKNEAGSRVMELGYSDILAVEESNNLVALFYDGMSALVIPKRALSPNSEASHMLEEIRRGAL